MLKLNVLAMALSIMLSLESVALLFSSKGNVKLLDSEKGFEEVMSKKNEMSLIAFLATDWCTECKRMVPEYAQAAKNLYPYVSAYAIDCSANSVLCAGQLKGLPTLKFFLLGDEAKVSQKVHKGLLNANQIFQWVMTYHVEEVSNMVNINAWVTNHMSEHRALILTTTETTEGYPLKWRALGVKYYGKLHLAFIEYKYGIEILNRLKIPEGVRSAKILLYSSGLNSKPTVYKGSTFIDHDTIIMGG